MSSRILTSKRSNHVLCITHDYNIALSNMLTSRTNI